jgi:cell division transport system permease protein
MTDRAASPKSAAGKAGPRAENQSVVSDRLLGRNAPLVPVSSIAGRALVTVIAIMTFLAALTAGGAQLVMQASSGWRSSIAQEVTIQVRPVAGRPVDPEVERAAAIARSAPGVKSVRVYSKEESERLLEPWLGAGLDLNELPIPRIIVVSVGPGMTDFSALRERLSEVRGASLDDHRLWVERLSAMANTIVLLAFAIVLLVIAATALAVAFATRGAMAGNKDIIAVLHFVGATDGYIAKEFQHHFLRLGLRGGALGGLAALLFFFLAGAVTSSWVATPGGDQVEAMFGTMALGFWGWMAVACIALLVALVTGVVSRFTVHRTLEELG